MGGIRKMTKSSSSRPIQTIAKQGGHHRKIYDANGRNSRSVWSFPTRPYKGAHFATFPIEMPTRCILAGSRPGDLVLDPFTGSGTTGEAAILTGRRFVGCELNEEYAALARDRIGGAAPLFSEATA